MFGFSEMVRYQLVRTLTHTPSFYLYIEMPNSLGQVPHLIEGHVLAKRYFCFMDPTYRDGLSDGSKRTLAFQGGPMTAEEAAIFETDPLFKACSCSFSFFFPLSFLFV